MVGLQRNTTCSGGRSTHWRILHRYILSSLERKFPKGPHQLLLQGRSVVPVFEVSFVGYGYVLWSMGTITELTDISGVSTKVSQKITEMSGNGLKVSQKS